MKGEMMSGGAYHASEQGSEVVSGDSANQVRNPLLCFICDDYYSEPCLLNCYHTFCSRCLRGRDVEGKITCPLCGQQTTLKEGMVLPPPDLLMRQLIELANAENPPCANCDKRDKASMCFCSTCGQALCSHCRENTHRAKMFSTHEVVHMSKCAKETHRRCALHGEQYIMFSNTQKSMLCVNCFRDTPAEARLHCVDIDTAYTQCTRKLEKAVVSVCELQNSVREGLLMFKTLLEELRQNMETEKHTINSFCQGMQEAIAKTHANMIMEVQSVCMYVVPACMRCLPTCGAYLHAVLSRFVVPPCVWCLHHTLCTCVHVYVYLVVCIYLPCAQLKSFLTVCGHSTNKEIKKVTNYNKIELIHQYVSLKVNVIVVNYEIRFKYITYSLEENMAKNFYLN
ncbi:RING finger protein 207-like isoform X2 [Bacillus rossius redtenbacheri]|uniref:RING finger protein 207-like isoform X2 n=1 Tax=Bacillus rossius redtenbacheri TaxID=93214 RepID=UPI002FDE8C10